MASKKTEKVKIENEDEFRFWCERFRDFENRKENVFSYSSSALGNLPNPPKYQTVEACVKYADSCLIELKARTKTYYSSK